MLKKKQKSFGYKFTTSGFHTGTPQHEFPFKAQNFHQDTLEDKAIIGVIGIPGHLKVLGGPHLGDSKKFSEILDGGAPWQHRRVKGELKPGSLQHGGIGDIYIYNHPIGKDYKWYIKVVYKSGI